MNTIPLQQRKFHIKLAPTFFGNYECFLFYLKRLLQRLGRESALFVWQEAFIDYRDDLLKQILSAEWKDSDRNEKINEKEYLTKYLNDYFTSPAQGVSDIEAKDVIEKTPPIYQMRESFHSLKVERLITAYEAIHLWNDTIALLAESLIKYHGKQGELIIYDIETERRTYTKHKPCSFKEFVTKGRIALESAEPNFLNCAVDAKIIKDTETEHIMHVTQCENARYFHERHPQVGYLIACSHDETDPKMYNKNVQLQRTSTIMEDADICDFRYCLIEGDS